MRTQNMKVRLPKKQARAKPLRGRCCVLTPEDVSGQRNHQQNVPRSLLDPFPSFNEALTKVKEVYADGFLRQPLAIFDQTGTHQWVIAPVSYAESACRTCFWEVHWKGAHVRRWDRHISQRVPASVSYLVHTWTYPDNANPYIAREKAGVA